MFCLDAVLSFHTSGSDSLEVRVNLQQSDGVPARVGLIAGEGDFPILIANAAESSGTQVVALCIKGYTSDRLPGLVSSAHWLELGQLGKAIEVLKAEGATRLMMAGRIPHNSIFQYRHFDWRAMKLMARAANKKADALLQTVCDEFAKEGIEVIESSTFLESLMPKPGLMTPNRPLTDSEWDNVKFGLPLARGIAGMDIGQTIVVKDRMVAAVEGLEGTDKCILRAGELAGPGCVVVKVSKPQQDLRFDIPIIGPGTVKNMVRAGATALALTSTRSLVFHRSEVIEAAEVNGIGIYIIDDKITDIDEDSK